MKDKKIASVGAPVWNASLGAFVVTLKSNADLATIKALKGEKIANKYRIAIKEVDESAVQETSPSKSSKTKPAAEEKSDEESEPSEEDEEEEESDEDVEEIEAPSPKKAKQAEPVKTEKKKKVSESESESIFRISGIPKMTPTDKLKEFFKQRGVSSANVKLQDNA